MQPGVTVVVVPRERHAMAGEALDVLLARTPEAPVIYVDAGAPADLRRRLHALETQRPGFRVLTCGGPLSPNQARNRALAAVATAYVAFIDNDALPDPGWLDALCRCADETGAALVGPLTLIGDPARALIHMAGGVAHIDEAGGVRRLREEHLLANRRVGDVQADLARRPVELVEFHCLLARTAALRALGPLDEGLLSLLEHVDLCLRVREAGGAIWLEPTAHVCYVPPARVTLADLPFFLLRWSEAWNDASLSRFRDRWRLDDGDAKLAEIRHWARRHRRLALRPLRRGGRKLLGERLYQRLDALVVRRAEDALGRLLAARQSVAAQQNATSHQTAAAQPSATSHQTVAAQPSLRS